MNPILTDKTLTLLRQNIGANRQKTGGQSGARSPSANTTPPATTTQLQGPLANEPLPPRTTAALSDPAQAMRLAARVSHQITRNQQQAAEAFAAISSGIVDRSLS